MKKPVNPSGGDSGFQPCVLHVGGERNPLMICFDDTLCLKHSVSSYMQQYAVVEEVL